MKFYQRKQERMTKAYSAIEAKLEIIQKAQKELERKAIKLNKQKDNLHNDILKRNYKNNKNQYRQKWPELYKADYRRSGKKFITWNRFIDWISSNFPRHLISLAKSAKEYEDIKIKIIGRKKTVECVSFAEIDKLFWFWGQSCDIKEFKLNIN